MQAQQQIALERNRELVGRRLRVLVEGPAEEEGSDWVGRSYRDAPEIDGVVFVRGAARPGEFVDVQVTEARPYDLEGEVTG
jgi:ribosomal protein S12 methylthiotransferase